MNDQVMGLCETFQNWWSSVKGWHPQNERRICLVTPPLQSGQRIAEKAAEGPLAPGPSARADMTVVDLVDLRPTIALFKWSSFGSLHDRLEQRTETFETWKVGNAVAPLHAPPVSSSHSFHEFS